jgi:hypothetical protein
VPVVRYTRTRVHAVPACVHAVPTRVFTLHQPGVEMTRHVLLLCMYLCSCASKGYLGIASRIIHQLVCQYSWPPLPLRCCFRWRVGMHYLLSKWCCAIVSRQVACLGCSKP